MPSEKFSIFIPLSIKKEICGFLNALYSFINSNIAISLAKLLNCSLIFNRVLTNSGC